MNWHLLPVSEVAAQLKTTPSGIDNASASRILVEIGKNQIEEKKKKTTLQMLLHQFTDFMILILIAAAIVSGVLGDTTDTIMILAIIVINAAVGFIQEYRADKAMEALKKMAASHARVIREGKTVEIVAYDLVPGDVILLEAGNIIPADVRFLEAHQLKVDESTLTGESHNAEKSIEPLPEGEYALGDRKNIGFKGTIITSGRAVAYAVATGMNTELGHIAKMIQGDDTITPLQKRLAVFGKRLSLIILGICAVIFIAGWLRGEDIPTLLLTSISLAVAAIPEALPVLVTVALAFGARRLVKSNALIRKLPAVETLGSVTYICSDKTGTLTQNKMTVDEIFGIANDNIPAEFAGTDGLLTVIALNHDVTKEKDGKWIGESTEIALAQYASEKNFERATLEATLPRLAELPFDSERKRMTTLHQTKNGIVAITKGAADELLTQLDSTQSAQIPEFEQKINEMSEKGYRVLAYAVRSISSLPQNPDPKEIESSLTLIGFAGLIDPPREEVKQAIVECKQAGIIPVMITGDHKLTAKAIAKTLGIISSDEDIVMSGSELAKLSQAEFEEIVEKVRVYARVNPEQKLKIIKGLQDKHQYVAMTGDGVNDAPALKNADIGIAMGIAGTEVSKEAAHMILLDDNYATIIIAVKHGRMIYDNILKFIKYIMTGNAGEIWAMLLAPFLGLPVPLLAIHILWINLVTDGLPALALASEPGGKDIMQRPPRDPKKSIFSGGMAIHILWVGFLIGIATLGTQWWAIHTETAHWQTMTFTVLCLLQLGHIMAIRSERKSIFKIGIFSNKPLLGALLLTVALQLMIIYLPFLNKIFKTQPLTMRELGITILVSSIAFWAVELEKLIRSKTRRHI